VLDYAGLSPEKLTEELATTSTKLAAAYTELAQVKIQYLWLYNQGYQHTHETSVSGREHAGEIAAMSVKEDELTLEGNIASLTAIRDLLVVLRG
jgi:hypothetical protein